MVQGSFSSSHPGCFLSCNSSLAFHVQPYVSLFQSVMFGEISPILPNYPDPCLSPGVSTSSGSRQLVYLTPLAMVIGLNWPRESQSQDLRGCAGKGRSPLQWHVSLELLVTPIFPRLGRALRRAKPTQRKAELRDKGWRHLNPRIQLCLGFSFL